MVVAGILALALALPTGALFGIGYGTGVRIGYEQIYPLLFPKGTRDSPVSASKNIKAINQIYNAIGGKEASQMGIAVGLSSAMSELDQNPDFQDLLKLESKLSGLTQSNSEQETPSSNRNSRGLGTYNDISLSEIELSKLATQNDTTLQEELDKAKEEIEKDTHQARLKFTQTVELMDFSQVSEMFNNLSSFPNWKKSIITRIYNKLKNSPEQLQIRRDIASTAAAVEYTAWIDKRIVHERHFISAKTAYLAVKEDPVYPDYRGKTGLITNRATIQSWQQELSRAKKKAYDSKATLYNFYRKYVPYKNVKIMKKAQQSIQEIKTLSHYNMSII